MDIYNQIDDLLAEQNMSRRKLAQLIGVAPSTFQSMMSRRRGMTFELLMQIAQKLDVSASQFYNLEPDHEYEQLVEILGAAGISLEETGFADEYYVWHTDAEDPKEDRVQLTYSELQRVVESVQRDADAHKAKYIKQRLDAELFWPKGFPLEKIPPR